MIHNQSFILENHETETLLDRLKEWRFGICPDGRLASEACFVLQQRPNVTVIPETAAKPLTTYIITGSNWTYNLAKIGVIYHLNDDALFQTLAESYMVFGSAFQSRTSGYNIAHAIRVQKYATIHIDNILRPTKGMEESIRDVLSETNEEVRWSKLMDFWNHYGYFWPRKIIFGFKEHLSEEYHFNSKHEDANAYHNIHLVLKAQMNKVQTRKDPYDLHDFMNNSVIVARHNLTPLHEFFQTVDKEKIEAIIQQRFTQIPVACHLKIYNPTSNSYLAWSPRHSQDKHGDNFVIRPLTKDSLGTHSDKQYLWRLAWTPTTRNVNSYESTHPRQAFCANHHHPPFVTTTVRGGSSIYIYPSCKTKLRQSNNVYLGENASTISDTIKVETHKMLLTCQSYQLGRDLADDPKANIRPLRLRRPEELLDESEMKWMIEYPGNRLKYATDTEFHIKLNVDEYIHKIKPLVQGDVIQLKQIGLLTAFDTDCSKITQEYYGQSLRKVKRLSQPDESKVKSKKALMCIDEKDACYSYASHSYWTIELATQDDLSRHQTGLTDLETRDDQTTLEPSVYDESDSPNRLRRTYSDSSIPTINTNEMQLDSNNNNNRAQYFENLAKNSTSKLLRGFIKKVTLDPLAHIVIPTRNKHFNNNNITYKVKPTTGNSDDK